MARTTMLHIRVDKEIKAQASEALAAMGLSVSDAAQQLPTLFVLHGRMPKKQRAALSVRDSTTRPSIP